MTANARPLLSNICSVRPNTALHAAFIRQGLPTHQIPYRDVRRAILTMIVDQGLHNPPSKIVFCNQDLENILEIKAFHIRQIDAALYVSLHLWSTHPFFDAHSLPISKDVKQEWGNPKDCANHEEAANTCKYLLRDSLRLVFLSAGVGDPSQRFLTLEDAYCHLCHYIFKNKNSIVDNRNLNVIIIDQDPLGAVFQVKGFHCEQEGRSLVMQHLQPHSELPLKKRLVPLDT